MELDWIQKKILLDLIRSDKAKVSELKPADMPDNAFAYHLNKLARAGVIKKTERATYELTDKGHHIIGKMSTKLDAFVEDIKTVIMLYAVINNNYLLFEWSRQPYLGKITPLYDRVPFGKTLHDAIMSASKDKLGYPSKVIYKNTAIVKIFKNNTLVTHMNAIIYRIENPKTSLTQTSRNGTTRYLPLENEQIMEGVDIFFNKLENSTKPFESKWHY